MDELENAASLSRGWVREVGIGGAIGVEELGVSPETIGGMSELGGLLRVAGDVRFTDANNIGASSANIGESSVFFDGRAKLAVDVLQGVAEMIVGVNGVATGGDFGRWWEWCLRV